MDYGEGMMINVDWEVNKNIVIKCNMYLLLSRIVNNNIVIKCNMYLLLSRMLEPLISLCRKFFLWQ